MRIRQLLLATSAMVLLAGCKPKPAPTPAEPETSEVATEVTPAAETESLHVKVLDCGTIAVSDLDAFSSAGDYKGQSGTLTDTCYVVHHPNGVLVWDLGLPGLLKGAGEMKQDIFTVSLDQTITDQLAEIGMSPGDVDYVAISHSHFDHVGQVGQLLNATWLVNEAELNYMLPPDGSDAKVAADQLALLNAFKPLKREVFTGEKDVFGDGTVIIFQTPGHTPGHTSLQLTLPESGIVLLTGDLYHRTESRELKRVPRFNFDEEMTLKSMAAFEDRAAALGAKVIIQHERADIEPLGGEIR